MGNCFTATNNQIFSTTDSQQIQQETIKSSSRRWPVSHLASSRPGERKTARFQLQLHEARNHKEEESNNDNGRVRIRVVVTKKELEQLVMCSEKGFKRPSVEQLVKAVRLRERLRIIYQTSHQYRYYGNWKPALESIPEDR